MKTVSFRKLFSYNLDFFSKTICSNSSLCEYYEIERSMGDIDLENGDGWQKAYQISLRKCTHGLRLLSETRKAQIPISAILCL